MHAMRHTTRFKRASTKPKHSKRPFCQVLSAALVQGAQSLGGICPSQIAKHAKDGLMSQRLCMNPKVFVLPRTRLAWHAFTDWHEICTRCNTTYL